MYFQSNRNRLETSVFTGYSGQKPLEMKCAFVTESVLSFRSDDSYNEGIFVPDYVADPYSWFIKNTNSQKRERAIKKYGERHIRHKYQAKGTNLPVSAVSNNPLEDTGHTFLLKKETYTGSALGNAYTWYDRPLMSSSQITGGPITALGATIGQYETYRMPFSFTGVSASFSRPIAPPQVAADYYSQRSIARMAPNRPEISLTAILGELREGLPSLPGILLLRSRVKSLRNKVPAKLAKKTLKKSASEFVNLNFGVVPLVSDIIAIASTLLHITEILEQYDRDSHKGVRRRFTLREKETVVDFSTKDLSHQGYVSAGTPLFPYRDGQDTSINSIYVGGISSRVQMTKTEKIYFSGSFSYYLPQGTGLETNSSRYSEMYAKLFGPGLTFEDIWQLTPWSWLSDWFFDIQSTISAHQRYQDESLVLNYGYLMSETEYKASQISSIIVSESYKTTIPTTISSTVKSLRKERLRANPYGFGIKTPEALNGFQSAIIAAIGLSRL